MTEGTEGTEGTEKSNHGDTEFAENLGSKTQDTPCVSPFPLCLRV